MNTWFYDETNPRERYQHCNLASKENEADGD